MSNPTLAQRTLAERHKSGAVLSQKKRQGQTLRFTSTHQNPFFAPSDGVQAERTVKQINGLPSTQTRSTPVPNPLLNTDHLLIELPFVTFDHEVKPAAPQVQQTTVNESSTLSPAIESTEHPQRQNGELKPAFSSTDLQPVAIGPAPTDTNQANPHQPTEAVPTAGVPVTSPTTPEADPQFQTALQGVRQAGRSQRKHPKPDKKVGEYVKAAVLPEPAQKKQNDSTQHLDTIDAAAVNTKQTKAFQPETFKELLKDNLTELEKNLPHSEDAAKRFKREKPLEAVKQNIGSRVEQVSATQLSSISSEVNQKEPPPSGLPVQTPQAIVPEPTGNRPQAIDPVAATPKPKADAEISMEAESRSMDNLMATRKITDQQLADSNEPSFLKTLDAKQQAKQKAAEAPQVYRQTEQQTLATAQQKASGTAQAKVGGMYGNRQQTFLEVFQQQNLTELADKSQQIIIDSQFQAIYEGTKNDVKRILDALSTYVDTTFSQESEAAKKTFEKVVEDQLDDIHGWGVNDFLFGEDTEAIERVFVREGDKFKRALNDTLDKIAVEIANRLNEAVDCIERGRVKAKTLFDGLDKNQQQLHTDTFNQFNTQFDNLRSSVDDKQAELAQSLAESYQANVSSLRETFDKINEEARKNWISKAVEFIEEAASAIYKLGQLLLSVLTRLANLISDIIAHPIRFLENVGAGIKQGFSNFIDKIDEYLLAGFFDWLRGSVSKGGIQLPTSFDPKGLFLFALQLLDLSEETFWKVAGERLGEPTVAVLRKGEALLEKGFEVFQILRKEGISGLWEHIKATISEHISETIAKIKETIFYEVIKKALAFVASLFTPVGAFIKAVQLLYNGIRFLIDNIDRIADLVNAFMDSLEMAVKGNVSGIANKVVQALRSVIVVAIDFLAKLLGLSNLSEKVHQVIQTIRKPVVRAMEYVIDKVKPFIQRVMKGGKALLDKGKQVVGKAIDSVTEWWKASKKFTGKDGKSHTLFLQGDETNAELMVASTTAKFSVFIQSIKPGESAEKQHAKDNAKPIAEEIDKKKQSFFLNKNKDLPKEEKKIAYQEHKKEIDALLNKLSVYVTILMDEKSVPTGKTKDDAIKMVWYKPENEYKPFTLIDELGQETTFSFAGGQKWFRIDSEKVRGRKRGTLSTKLEGLVKAETEQDGVGLFVELGVKGDHRIKNKDKIYRTGSYRNVFKGKYQEALRLILERHGMNLSGLDADHVKDLQFGGVDDLENLWPLNAGINQSSLRFADQIVTYKKDDDSVMAVPLGHEDLKNKWFDVEQTKLF